MSLRDLPEENIAAAICWTCDQCNRKNFTICEEEDGENLAQIYRAVHDLLDSEPLPEGWRDCECVKGVYVKPDIVECCDCKSRFHVPMCNIFCAFNELLGDDEDDE